MLPLLYIFTTTSITAAGKYSDQVGQVSQAVCKPCDAGRYTLQTGQNEQTDCTECEKGHYCPVFATKHPTNNTELEEWDGGETDGAFKLSTDIMIASDRSLTCGNSGYSAVQSWICVTAGKTLSIIGADVSEYVKISANGRVRHFTVDGTGTVLELSRVHITQGKTDHSWGGCLIAGHGAGYGHIVLSNTIISNCSFTSASTSKAGGGLYVESHCSAVVSNTIFRNNDYADGGSILGRDLYIRAGRRVVLVNVESETPNGLYVKSGVVPTCSTSVTICRDALGGSLSWSCLDQAGTNKGVMCYLDSYEFVTPRCAFSAATITSWKDCTLANQLMGNPVTTIKYEFSDDNWPFGCFEIAGEGLYFNRKVDSAEHHTKTKVVRSICKDGDYSSKRIRCPIGRYGDQTGQNKAASCKLCEIGKYSIQTGQLHCKWCKTGKHQPQAGQTSCKACEEGFYCSSPCAPKVSVAARFWRLKANSGLWNDRRWVTKKTEFYDMDGRKMTGRFMASTACDRGCYGSKVDDSNYVTPAALNNGQFGGYWSAIYGSSGRTEWYGLDLGAGESKVLQRVYLDQEDDHSCCYSASHDISIEYSHDGSSWTEVGKLLQPSLVPIYNDNVMEQRLCKTLVSERTPCPIGRYSDQPAQTNVSGCKLCGAGRYTLQMAQTAQAGCIQCERGFYCDSLAGPKRTPCPPRPLR